MTGASLITSGLVPKSVSTVFRCGLRPNARLGIIVTFEDEPGFACFLDGVSI